MKGATTKLAVLSEQTGSESPVLAVASFVPVRLQVGAGKRLINAFPAALAGLPAHVKGARPVGGKPLGHLIVPPEIAAGFVKEKLPLRSAIVGTAKFPTPVAGTV